MSVADGRTDILVANATLYGVRPKAFIC